VQASQKQMVLSRELLVIVFPSGEKAQLVMLDACPMIAEVINFR
jgi:hypothetical protein